MYEHSMGWLTTVLALEDDESDLVGPQSVESATHTERSRMKKICSRNNFFLAKLVGANDKGKENAFLSLHRFQK